MTKYEDERRKRQNSLEIVPRSQCGRCKHYDTLEINCRAFPNGIPRDIMSDRFDHRKPYPGDHGIRFTPKQKKTS